MKLMLVEENGRVLETYEQVEHSKPDELALEIAETILFYTGDLQTPQTQTPVREDPVTSADSPLFARFSPLEAQAIAMILAKCEESRGEDYPWNMGTEARAAARRVMARLLAALPQAARRQIAEAQPYG